MNNSPLVSIIVPVFRAEKYLSHCIDSVLGQTYRNIELVLVNDCSPDKSMEIARSYSSKDTRVKFLEQEKNLGPMRARDNGIRASSGKWITFLDSDDWFSADAIESFVIAAESNKADVVAGILHRVDNNGKLITEERYTLPFGETSTEVIKALFSQDMSHTLCGKFFAKYIFEEPLIIEDNNTNAEDAFVFYQIVDRIQKMITISDVTYYYRQGSSATPRGKRMSEKQIRNIASFWVYLHTDFVTKHPEYKDAVEQRTLRNLLSYFKEGYNKKALYSLISDKFDFRSLFTNQFIRAHATSINERIFDILLFNSQAFRWIVSKTADIKHKL